MAPRCDALPSVFQETPDVKDDTVDIDVEYGVPYRPDELIGRLLFSFVEAVIDGVNDRASAYLSLARQVMRVAEENQYVPGESEADFTVTLSGEGGEGEGEGEESSGYDSDSASSSSSDSDIGDEGEGEGEREGEGEGEQDV
jgi:hypothetical protein